MPDLMIILFLVVLNGVFAMSELAMFAAQKTRLQQLANAGARKAERALDIREHPTAFLSTTQVGITLVGILAGAVSGVTFAEQLAAFFEKIPMLAPYRQPVALALVVLVLTYVSVVFGELIPKRLALLHAERLACAVAPPMHFLASIASPAVRVLTASTDGVLRLFGVRRASESQVTEEDIRVLIQEGADVGVVEETEHELMKSVFELSGRSVGSLMTPRPDIIWLDLDDSREVNLRKIAESAHSRFPVGRGDLDQLLGVVEVRDLLRRALAGEKLEIEACTVRPLIVPESASALQLLEQFQESPIHVAMVADEYGGIEGLVTRLDVLQALVGSLPSDEEDDDPPAVRREDGSWLLDGSVSIDDFRKHLQIEALPDETKGDYQTLAGLVMAHLGRIPITGSKFVRGDLRFEVVDMDRHRIDKVLVTPLPPPGPPPSDV